MMNFNSITGLNSAMGAQHKYGNAFAPASNSITKAAQNYGNAFAPATSALNASLGQVNPRSQTPINPKAMSNQGTISGMFGQEMPGTFNRSVGNAPLMQMTSQGYVPPMDPTNPSMEPDINALVTGNTGQPLMPPSGVQQPITPFYDLSNQ